MKRASAAFALTTLVAATITLAQTVPQTKPPAGSTPQEQQQPSPTPQPSDPSTGKSNAQSMLKDCITQVKAANPSVPDADIRAYCDQQVKRQSSPRD